MICLFVLCKEVLFYLELGSYGWVVVKKVKKRKKIRNEKMGVLVEGWGFDVVIWF